MTIDEQLAEWRDKIARAGSCWGSTDARVADDAKHMLCKLATADFTRTIAAIEEVKKWRDEVMKSYDGGYGISHHDIRELDDILAKLAGEV